MSSGIYLGNFSNQNGRATSAVGVSSGIDSEALINGILKSKEFEVTEKKDKIEINDEKLLKIKELGTILDRFQQSADFLKNPPGFNNQSKDLFSYTKASISYTAESSNSKALEAISLPGAQAAKYNLSNIKIAKEHIITKTFSSVSDPIVGGINFAITNNDIATGDILDSDNPVLFSNDIETEATQYSSTINFSNNEFNNQDSLTIGSTTLTFGKTSGDDLSLTGTLEENLEQIANYMNSKSTGEESNYKYEVADSNTLLITKYQPGSTPEDNKLIIKYDFSHSNDQDISINIIDGADSVTISNEMTEFTQSLEGPITNVTTEFINGSGSKSSFVSNKLRFKAIINGESYTSKTIDLGNGSLDLDNDGLGDNNINNNGYGNILQQGSIITFVKDVSSSEKKDITFQFKIGTEQVINNQSDADSVSSAINKSLSDNDILVTHVPNILSAGTFSLAGVNITLKDGENLQSITSKINSVSLETGISAAIIKASDNDYILQLKSLKTGTLNRISEYGEKDPLKIKFGNNYVEFIEKQAPTDASFEINGTTITRSENTINDVIDNVSFTLNSDMKDEISLEIENDASHIKDGINDFINSYNELILFISKQQQRDSNNQLLETSVLGDEKIIDDIRRDIVSEVMATVKGSQGSFNNLFEIGIDTIQYPGDDENPVANNILILDEEKLSSALKNDFNGVKEVFGFIFSNNSTELSVFKSSNNISITDLQFDIDITRDEGNKVRVLDLDGNFLFNADYDSNLHSIKGRRDTSLSGLELVYSGNGQETIKTQLSQGIADKIFNTISNFKNPKKGFIKLTKNTILSKNIRLEQQIDLDKKRINAERERLINKFSKLESVISVTNSLLSFFEAQRAQLYSK